jgi:hypothetical protein
LNDRIVPERLGADHPPARLEHARQLTHRGVEIDVMQDAVLHRHVERVVRELERLAIVDPEVDGGHQPVALGAQPACS